MKINKNFLDLEESYLFSTVNKKTREFAAAHPEADIIKLSIGDVTRPICPAVIDAMHKAVDEMADEKTFRGYPPEQGYDFVRQKILDNDYIARGIDLQLDEIFLSDGAKSDCGNIGDIFATDNTVAICDPVYPVYIDTNIMNRRKDKIIILPCSAENNFLPELPSAGDKVPDIIYLCFPNNPTGTVASKEYLTKWVEYANANHSLILYDSAYEAFITDGKYPKSIYEIPGAKTCAIELRSFSKTAGFTGTRCGYTIVPKNLYGGDMNKMWVRRQTTKFNGTSYIVQRGAAAVFTEQGQKEIKEQVAYYMNNAHTIHDELTKAGLWHVGGVNSPYIWLEVPAGMTSWEYFDALLNEGHVVGTPGVGFGAHGEGFFRLTGFGNKEKTEEAIKRLVKVRR